MSKPALASLSLPVLMPSLATSIVNAALPELARAFGSSFQQAQWIVLAYLVSMTTSSVAAGKLGDRIGRRRLLTAGIVLFTSSSLLCGVAPTLATLIAARAGQGAGAALMMSLTIAIASDTASKAGTGAAMGLLGTMSAAGTALGPALGGVLMATPGWRAIFFANVPAGLLALLLVRRYVPGDGSTPGAHREGADALGSFLLAVTLSAYALAMTMGAGHFGPVNLALLLAAACGVAGFLLAERSAASPLVPLALLRDPAVSASLVSSAIVSAVMMATLVVGPFYLSRALGLTAAEVGLVLSVGPGVAALSGVPAGRLVDRRGAHRMTKAGQIGIAGGSAFLFVLPAWVGLVGYIVPIAAMTASYALFQAANTAAIMDGTPTTRRGLVAGLLGLSRNLGFITGASAMGALFTLASATSDIVAATPEAVAAGMQRTFGVAALMIVVALVVVMSSTRYPHRP
ncbi:MAG: MFS transporter [Vicinamibacterales bacterium]